MLDQLKQIVDSTPSRALGIKVKSKKNLYEWILANTTSLIDVTISERIYYLLLGSPNIICKNGNKQKFIPLKLNYGFCGSSEKCQCFKDRISEFAKSVDANNIVEKRKITWLKKYGVENVSQCKEIQDTRKNTMLSRDYSASFKNRQHNKETTGLEQKLERLKDQITPLFKREDYNGCFRKNFYLWECNHCKTQFQSHVDNGSFPRCPTCYPNNKSISEFEIKSWLESYNIKVISNDRTILSGYELDLWLPDHNIGIELNGVYWHSSKFKSKTYHVDKMLECQTKNIHLLQIFEDELFYKPDIVKNRILSYLGLNHKYFARKCTISVVNSLDYKNFVNKHHLQGYAQANIVLGLVDNENNLKAIMSFGKPRYSTEEYEMIRYCSDGNVIGGASKLFKYFITTYNPSTVISYANRCWSQGTLYKKLGFVDITENIKNTSVWYFKRLIRFHRSSLTKKRLIKLGYDKTKTADAILEELGYLKIFDCGNLKFRWTSTPLDTD